MAGKYTELTDSNWDDRTLYTESIPHLFHVDLLYLWMLEKDSAQRARAWRDRIEGWRRLVCMFMLGELHVEEEAIQRPFLAYTAPFGVDRVSWLVAGSDKNASRVGVLSPTVLVRPLPDFTAAMLDTCGDPAPRMSEVRHFVDLAVRRLTEGQDRGIRSFRSRLAELLTREFSPARLANDPAGRPVTVRLLRRLGWAPHRLDQEKPLEIELLIRESAEGPWIKTYVPRCGECNALLTQSEAAEAKVASGDSIELVCPSGHANTLPLSDFLIWNRSPNSVVVWRDDRLVPLVKGAPPPRTIRGIEVAMEWNEGLVGGGPERFLRIAFPGKTLQEHRLEEIFFEKLLVPGMVEQFGGMPIRPEWIDILEKEQVAPEIEPALPRIVYRDLRLRGWPVPVIKVFGGLSLALRDQLAVGIYPNPAAFPLLWKWFRAFLNGPPRRGYKIAFEGGSVLLPWVLESTSGLPLLVAVTSTAEPQTGVTFRLSHLPAPESQVAAVHVGVDFGTTNSLLAYYPLAFGGGVNHDAQALRPAELVQYVAWLAPSAAIPLDDAVGDFLPPHRYRQDVEDAHLVPSSLWLLPGRGARHLIRWNSSEPIAGATAKSGFKWEPLGGSLRGERISYLRELLLLSLPAIIARSAPRLQVTTVHFGFAFPLAFDHSARKSLLELLEELVRELKDLIGLSLDFVHMSESAACMRAFGAFEHGDIFVVADMGGGTLDLALFTAGYEGQTKHYQIGSLRFAGEDGVQALAAKKGSRAPDDRVVWDLRDQIQRGHARSLYRDDNDARQVANRLVVFAFEYIRTMVAAHRKGEPEQAAQKIRIVLVGNGWRLSDAFADRARQLGPVSYFWEFYQGLVGSLGEPNLELYSGDPLRRLPSSKHLLVHGALENTIHGQLRELEGEVTLSRLPAGRSVTFTPPGRPAFRIGWDRIVGEDRAAAIEGVSKVDLKIEHMRTGLHDKPAMSDSWRDALLAAFAARDEASIPYPDEPKLRAAVGMSIEGRLMGRGPLQVIIEGRWKEELKK